MCFGVEMCKDFCYKFKYIFLHCTKNYRNTSNVLVQMLSDLECSTRVTDMSCFQQHRGRIKP